MDESLARNLLEELRNFVATFNNVSELSMSIADEEEQRTFRAALARLLVHCDSELIRPLERKYPQLEGIVASRP